MCWWSRLKGNSAGWYMLLSQCRGDGKLLQVGWVDQGESQGMECVCVCGGGIVWYRGVGGWSRRLARLEVVMHQRLEARAARPHFFSTSSSSSSSCSPPSWDPFFGGNCKGLILGEVMDRKKGNWKGKSMFCWRGGGGGSLENKQ